MFMKKFPTVTSKKEIVSYCKRLCKVDIKPFLKKGYGFCRLYEIATALYNDIPANDVFHFANMNFNSWQLRVIFNGLTDNVDVSQYAKTEFNDNQMLEIYRGLKNGIDVTVYAKPEFDSYYMQQIRLAMETNHHEELFKFINAGNYTAEQLREIRLGLEVDLDVNKYANIEYSSELMKILREGIEKGLHPDVYLEYYYKGFTTDQLAVIRDGYLAKVNVKLYANLTTPPKHMRTILNRLIDMKE